MRITLTLLFICFSVLQIHAQTAEDMDKIRIGDPVVFGKKTDIKDLKHTEVVPTMVNPAPVKSNVVYSPIFLLCWEKLRDTLGGVIKTSSKYADTINKQVNYKSALAKDEYVYGITKTPGSIRVVTKFKKALHFTQYFQKNSLYWGGGYTKPEAAFGIREYDTLLARQVQILYYKSDELFVIKLLAKETNEDLILAKGVNKAGSLESINKKIDELIAEGARQKKLRGYEGKYIFKGGDKLLVPVLKFNLEKSYDKLIGVSISNNKGNDGGVIAKARQQTAFLLNEEGVKVEAEAEIIILRGGPMEPLDAKHLYFDKPFTVVMRKKGQTHPYLMVKVENTELMVK